MSTQNKETQELSAKDALIKQYEDAKFQLSTLSNVVANLCNNGKLRPGVKEKDIEMVSDAIIKIKSSLKDILNELKVMEERQGALETQFLSDRNEFTQFLRETGVKGPKILREYYQIDG